MAWWGGGSYWPEYVSVATRVARANKAAEKLRKKGVKIQPVELSGRKIATSFWGKGWCDHMDSFHDYENRLPRGRSYVRNGSVVHLEVSKGKISALVAGTKTYTVEIGVELLPKTRWNRIKSQCAGQIASLVDLLKGKLSDGMMRVVASRDNGLFPGPGEIGMRCSCPDSADMCKHIAAVFYGVGARLDRQPELLFLLRGVDHAELAAEGGVDAVIGRGRGAAGELSGADLSEVFGIELVDADAPAAMSGKPAATGTPIGKSRRKAPKKTPGKKPATLSEPPTACVSSGTEESAPQTGRKPSKRKNTAQKSATAELASSAPQKPPKPASRRPKGRRSTSTAKSDKERLEMVERLVAEYVSTKKEKRGKGKKKAQA